MNRKETLETIKSLLKFSSENVTEEVETQEEKFLDARLEDGTIVRVDADDFAEGLEIMIVTEDGTQPAPAGEHTLEDGRVVTVEENEQGVAIISSISEVTEEDEEIDDLGRKEEKMSDETEEESEVENEEESEEESTDETEEVEEEVNLEDKINQLEALVNELIENQKVSAEAQVEMSKLVSKFASETPASEKEDVKSEFSQIKNEKRSTFESNLESLRKMRTKK